MSRVWEVRFEGKHYAMKIVNLKVYNKVMRLSQDLTHEVEILRILDHPSIPKLHHTIKTYKDPYNPKYAVLLMDLVKGKTLREYLEAKPEGRLSIKEAKSILKQLLSTLAYLEDLKVYHRNLTLENLMID